MTLQGPGGVSGPSTAAQGGSATVKVESGDASATVVTGANPGASSTVPVPPGGSTPIPIPPAPFVGPVAVVVGKGNRKSIHLIEVIAP